jgi:anti-sigma factor RsiW
MNQPVPEDGLSAYFDEELSLSEEREIRRQLSESKAAQKELAEIRRLSEVLRELPKESPPRNLLTDVMNQINQKSASPRSISHRVWTAGKWLAGLAALVLAAVWLPSPWNRTDNANSDNTIAANSEGTDEHDSHRTAVPSRDSFAEKLAGDAAEAKFGDGQETPDDAQIARSQANRSTSPLTTGPLVPGIERPMALEADRILMADENAHDKSKAVDSDWEGIVELAARGQDQVMVVEIATADAQKALQRLQFALAQEKIGLADARRKMLPRFEGAAGRIPQENNAERALYVQSSGAQIQAALARLRQQDPALKLESQTALALNRLPDLEAGKDQLGGRGASRFGGFGGRGQPQNEPLRQPTPNADTPPRQTKADDKKPGESKKETAPPEAAVPSFAASGIKNLQVEKQTSEEADEAAQIESFQILLPALTEQFRRDNPPADAKAESALEPEAADGAPLEEAEKAAEAKKNQAQPVRIMFIFRKR